jgi:hypothetical protein
MLMQRTDLAEEFVARFASVPWVAECVFLRPKYLRGSVEREVADNGPPLMNTSRPAGIATEADGPLSALSPHGNLPSRIPRRPPRFFAVRRLDGLG